MCCNIAYSAVVGSLWEGLTELSSYVPCRTFVLDPVAIREAVDLLFQFCPLCSLDAAGGRLLLVIVRSDVWMTHKLSAQVSE